MSEIAMGTYVLIWPIISALVLAVMLGAIIKDIRVARREQRSLV